MKKILVVEDSDFVRENLIDVLELNNYKTISVDNGYDGYRKAIDELPDLIIADIMMPVMDGRKMLRLISENPITRNIPFIFLTAKSSAEEMRDGMNLGADDYITKPFTSQQIIDAVRIRLEKRERITKKFENSFRNISTYIPHELRTPLASILGFTDMLSADFDTLGYDEKIEIIQKIKFSSNKLHKVIEKFILFSDSEMMKSNRGGYEELLLKNTEIHAYVIDYIIKEKMKNFENTLPVIMNVTPGKIKMADEHFNIILNELIDNAIKFSFTNNPIEIKTEEDEDSITLFIKNFGRGMAEEEIKTLQPFVQYRRQYYEQSGNGLGLMIVKNLASFYGAELNLKSHSGKWFEASIKILKNQIGELVY